MGKIDRKDILFMTDNPSAQRNSDRISNRSQAEQAVATVVRALRFGGALLLLAGLGVFFDAGGVRDFFSLKDNAAGAQILGGALMIAGIIDLVLAPRLLEAVKPRMNRQ